MSGTMSSTGSPRTVPGSEHATFKVVEDADADVLIVAAEDRTGLSNGPLRHFSRRLAELPLVLHGRTNRERRDVRRLRRRRCGREAPDHLGVMSHYDTAIWYTGNDFVTRESGRGPGNVAARERHDPRDACVLERGWQPPLHRAVRRRGRERGRRDAVLRPCIEHPMCQRGWPRQRPLPGLLRQERLPPVLLGGYIYNYNAGTAPDGQPYPIEGVGDPFTGLDWMLQRCGQRQQPGPHRVVGHDEQHPAGRRFPQFDSDAPAAWVTGFGGTVRALRRRPSTCIRRWPTSPTSG